MGAANTVDTSYQQKKNNRDLGHIPGNDGLPGVGITVDVLNNLLGTAQGIREKYGPVSRTNLMGEYGVWVTDNDLYQRIYQDREQNFSAMMGYLPTLSLFYNGGLLLMDFDEHKAQRRLMQSAFKMSAIKKYTEMMHPYIVENLKSWGSMDSFVFYEHIKKILLEIAAKCFFGLSDAEGEMKHVNNLFHTVNLGLTTVVRVNTPFTTFGKALRARKELEQWFIDLIRERRKNGGGEDMVSHMCREKTEDGELWPEDIVMMHAIFLMFAAHDTTSSALTNMALHVGRDQALQNRLREQSMALGQGPLNHDDMPRLELHERTFHEIIRLYPPVPVMMRRCIREFEACGVRIPEHTLLYMPTVMNHIDPRWWSDPLKFDPDRFLPERAEQKNHPLAWHPFGHGIHKCLGMHFAEAVFRSVTHQLLMMYKFETPPNYNPETSWIPLPRAKDGVPLKLTPL